MTIIGVDPGKKGGYAIIEDDHYEVFPWDDDTFVNRLQMIESPAYAFVEKVGAMPGQGVTSMFHFGKSAGYIEGVLSAFKIKYDLIPPQRWKKAFELHSDKQESINKCIQLFPKANLLPTSRCKKPSDGMAEALLIAEYGRKFVSFPNET